MSFMKLKDHYLLQTFPSLDPPLSHMKPTHIVTAYDFKTLFNIILPSTYYWFPTWFFPLQVSWPKFL